MPDKDPERLKPATDLLMNSANQVASDRARRINSLHKQVDGLLQEETKKRRQVGSEIGSIVQQQEQLRKQLGIERDQISADVASGYGKVVNNLGNTIKQLSIGMKNISLSTARASSDAISQYGKAVSQDISINKTNTIAMALSRATPIFGYFAAKFMETDVFRGAISKIRQGVGGAMLAGLRGAGSAISNIFRGKSTGEKIAGREREIGALASEVSSLKKELQAKPPQLQAGGYVKKGGVVEVHAAEVIAPVDKLVKQIVETTQDQQKKSQRSFLRTFIREFKGAGSPKEEAWQDRMLKAIIELKTAFIGTTSRLRIAWQRTLLENPAFRGMLMFAEGFKLVLGAPIKWLFGARGGYLSDVKKATATDNVFLKIANVLGLIYTTGMPKFDAIAKYTRVSATVAAGYEPKPPMQDKYTMFQKVKGWLAGKKKGKAGPGAELKEMGKGWLWEQLGVDQEVLEEFRAEGGFKAILEMAKEGGEKGLEKGKELSEEAKEDISNKLFDLEFKRRGMAKTLEAKGGMAGLGKEAYEELKTLTSDITKLRKLKETQEEREKPHSPSWVDNIASTYTKAKERVKLAGLQVVLEEVEAKKRGDYRSRSRKYMDKHMSGFTKQYDEIKKSRKAQQLQNSFLGRMTKRLKKLGGWGWKILMFAFNIFQGMINAGVAVIGQLFGPILSMLGIRGLFRSKGTKGARGWGQTASDIGKSGKKKAGTLGRFAKKTGRAQSRFGTKTALKFAGKRTAATALGTAGRVAGAGARVAGGLAGAALGGVMGVGMGVWDMVSAMRSGEGEGFVGGWLAKGVSGFLGGKDTGVSGALSGAMKLGGIGAMVGSVIPGVGTLIGGAIGAAAGALLGFIGGGKISKAINAVVQPIKKIVKAWWAYISFPFKFLWEMGKLVKYYFNEYVWQPVKSLWDKVTGVFKGFRDSMVEKWKEMENSWGGRVIKLMLTQLWNNITLPFRIIGGAIDIFKKVYSGLREWITSFIEKIKAVPFIGKFLKGIKDVHEGTFAEKHIKERETKKHYAQVAPAAPGGIMRPFETQQAGAAGSKESRRAQMNSARYAREILGATSIRFVNGVARYAEVGGKWYKINIDNSGLPKEIIGQETKVKDYFDPDEEKWMKAKVTTDIKSELYKRKATAEQMEGIATTLSDKIGETGKSANQIAIGSTTILSNTIANTSNSAVGGGGGGGGQSSLQAWGSGYGAAADVTHSNLN